LVKQIKLLSMHIQNFKGCKDRTIEFGEKCRISGANATGKTTIFDAFTWLLFGKDSLGSSDFEIRPLDIDGNMINNIEISVEAKISVDGDEYDLKKVQKQNWVKKRGTDTREFQGNVNEFDINGYPKSQKEFKEFISGIVKEDVFNLITNPSAFNALHWEEQREILMKIVGCPSNVEIAKTFGEKYALLIPELKIASTDDILKKYKKARIELKKDEKEIPPRIDEASKSLVIADVGAWNPEESGTDRYYRIRWREN
jgi:DNA repair protein SbcC/Rad50